MSKPIKSKLSYRAFINKLAFKADLDKLAVKSLVNTLCKVLVNNLILDKDNSSKTIEIMGLGVIESKLVNGNLFVKIRLNEKNKAIVKNM